MREVSERNAPRHRPRAPVLLGRSHTNTSAPTFRHKPASQTSSSKCEASLNVAVNVFEFLPNWTFSEGGSAAGESVPSASHIEGELGDMWDYSREREIKEMKRKIEERERKIADFLIAERLSMTGPTPKMKPSDGIDEDAVHYPVEKQQVKTQRSAVPNKQVKRQQDIHKETCTRGADEEMVVISCYAVFHPGTFHHNPQEVASRPQNDLTTAQVDQKAPGCEGGEVKGGAGGESRGGNAQIQRPGDEGRRAGVYPSADRKVTGGEGGEGAAAMQKGTEYAVGDSNVENIGSAEDRAARLGAAMTELAWSGAGEVPGIEVWRVHNKRTEKDNPDFGIERVPRAEYRQFYRGDSYIVLYTYKMPDNEALLYNVHFWIGANSTQDEYGVAAYKTVELDDLLGDVPIQYREMEGSESELFLSYFQPGGVCAGAIEILEGGHASGFRHVKPEEYGPRLMWVRKEGSQMLSSELPLELSSLNQGDCFILDSGNTLYIYQGESSSLFEKNKAINVATGMKQQRSEQSKVVSP